MCSYLLSVKIVSQHMLYMFCFTLSGIEFATIPLSGEFDLQHLPTPCIAPLYQVVSLY